MKKTEQEFTLPSDRELDAVLAEMAEEAPPMPADFHERWMNAVRAEQGNPAPAGQAGEEKNRVSAVRWTRILSIAATLIFLIGGTVLYRNSGKNLDTVGKTGKKAARTADIQAPAVMEAAEDAADRNGETEEKAAEEPLAEDAAVWSNETEGAAAEDGWTDYAEREEAAEEPDMDPGPFAGITAGMEADGVSGEPPRAAANGLAAFSSAAYESEPLSTSMPEEAPPEPEQAEEEAAEGSAEEPGEEPAEESAEEPAGEPAGEPGTGFLREAGAFLADMGRFLLAALPYLAVLAVPAAAALIIGRRKKKKK